MQQDGAFLQNGVLLYIAYCLLAPPSWKPLPAISIASTNCPRLHGLKHFCQLHKRRVRHDLLGRNEKILPLLIAVRLSPARGNFTVLDSALFLGDNIRVTELVLALYLHKINRIVGLHNEIRLIVMPVIVGDIEFLWSRAKPVLHIGVRLQHPCKYQFGAAVKLGGAEYAPLDTLKQN